MAALQDQGSCVGVLAQSRVLHPGMQVALADVDVV